MITCFRKMQEIASKRKKKEMAANAETETASHFLEPLSGIDMAELVSPEFTDIKIEREVKTRVKKQMEYSFRLGIEHMPDIILGKIISYLHWKEKEWFLLGVPKVERVMNSPLAWESFENDRNYAVEKLYMYVCFPFLMEHELCVIKKYGRFFQTCTIWVYKVTALDKERESDFRLLRAVSEYCKNLKTLSIMHTSDVSIPMLKTCALSYLRPLQELALIRGAGFRLSLNRLFYASIESVQTGIFSYLTYLQDKGLLTRLSCLDFSHGLILDLNSDHTVVHLLECVNLHTLKCPLQSLTTTIIIHLGNRCLKDLYVVNDDHTYQSCFVEILLDWKKIYAELTVDKKNGLNVHYIFKNRAVCNTDIVPNPFLRSLIFDNLSSNISASLLHHIANLYGQTILTLAFCSNYWEFLMHFADLGRINESFKYLARKCVKLTSFLSCLSLPSSALVSLARNSARMSTVRVYKDNIRLAVSDKPEEVFLQKMMEALGIPHWDMVKKGDNIYVIPNVNCKLLFASCFNEF